ncbi:LysE family translocator [Maricaulis maris]|jgi:threonine/homoserine/homoserine lactone efflux protein|uniref:Lysine exporter protein (LYSE/YGGA) n=1 Tax=Maricaulis maris (strain MCS10) TaxID=394221 RepID=Q0ATT1_MARMM|nr:LysE family translocator [Maricaulis maris]ABI64306.1 Lysine exporter protein (LYSE/YGGA) [Maricaulis maris MCS10]
MTIETLLLFAGALLVLFLTPGPGIAAMIARTLDTGPWHAAMYGAGILLGDMFWFTLAVTGLSAVAEQLGPFWLAAKLVGASYLGWMAYKAFWSAWTGARPKPVFKVGSKRGWIATFLAGIAMPLSNPKPIVFYLTLVPAFVPIEAITPWSFAAMLLIMVAMAVPTAAFYIAAAHRARAWLSTPTVRRGADILTGCVMTAIALLLLLR